jgi:electron transport complex protein RnfC
MISLPMKVYSLPRGGIVYDDPTVPPRGAAVTAFLPGLSVVSLVQHTGKKAAPVVAVGDRVREGMIVGRGQGPGSANVHATVPGRVIKTVSWKGEDGRLNEALVIAMEGSFEKLGRAEEVFPWEGLTAFDLQRLIAEYGVVEMEGPGRPAADLLRSFYAAREPAALVVRCVFDDPWLQADYALCRERPAAVAEGALIAARAGGLNRIIFAVSHREKEIGTLLMNHRSRSLPPADLVLTGSRYPQRNHRELERALRRYGKDAGLEIGAILPLGPATLAAIHDAVKLKKPVLERYVAVGGSAIKNPQVLKVRIGTRIGEIFAECGGFVDRPRRTGTGSPLMGRAVTDLDEPVIKTSFAVFAVLQKQVGAPERSRCIGCGECRRVCPLGIDPEALYKYEEDSGREALPGRADECYGCGCCELVCPSRLPLRTGIMGLSVKGNAG